MANTSVNTERINNNISILLQRFENIMALAAVRLARQLALLCDSANGFLTVRAQQLRRCRRRSFPAGCRRERTRKLLLRCSTSCQSFTHVKKAPILISSDVQIGAAEDLLSVTRIMKEMWLFGKLNTVGEDERDIEIREKMEADVLAIWKAIEEKNLLRIGLMSFGEPSEEPSEQPSEKPTPNSSQNPAPEPSAEI